MRDGDVYVVLSNPGSLGNGGSPYYNDGPLQALAAVSGEGVEKCIFREIIKSAKSSALGAGRPTSRRLRRDRVDRRHDSFGRLDDLAGIEAEILAVAHRHDLDAGAQLAVAADRHGEAGQAEQRRDQGGAHRFQHLRLAVAA